MFPTRPDVTSPRPQMQDKLYLEMRGRIKEEDSSVPTRYKGFWYYSRTAEGQQYKVHCRRALPASARPQDEADAPDAAGGAEEVLLDENARKEEGRHDFYMVSAVDESPDQKLLAWAEDTVGGEKYTLHVKVRIHSGNPPGSRVLQDVSDPLEPDH